MDQIAALTPEQAMKLWRDYQSRQQLHPYVQHNYPQRRQIDEVSPHRVFLKNTEEEVIPPYACCRILGTEEIGGRTAITVEKPTSLAGEFVFNSQFEIPATSTTEPCTGWGYRHEIIVMKGNGTPPTAANVEYTPIVASWEIKEGAGPFVVFGEHSAATNAVIGRIQGNGTNETAWATITESGPDDVYQNVTLYRSASPDTFTTATCGDVEFDDMQHTLCDVIGTATVLVPAGYKAGEAGLIKMRDCGGAHAWDGWVVIFGPRMRCATEIPVDVVCCPITQEIKIIEWKTIWFFGGELDPRLDPCPEA